MFILVAVLAAAALFLLSGLWLALRLPGWEAALGVSRLPTERRRFVDAARLRKALSIAFFAFSAAFLILLLCLFFRALSQKAALALCFLQLALFLDAVIILYRHFDSAQYPAISRRAGLIAALCVNLILAGLAFVLLTA